MLQEPLPGLDFPTWLNIRVDAPPQIAAEIHVPYEGLEYEFFNSLEELYETRDPSIIQQVELTLEDHAAGVKVFYRLERQDGEPYAIVQLDPNRIAQYVHLDLIRKLAAKQAELEALQARVAQAHAFLHGAA